MKNWLFFLLLLFLTASKCKEDAVLTTQLNINFKTIYNTTPFVLNKTYPYTSPSQVKFTRFNFFITKIALIGAKGTTIALADAAKLDFTPLYKDATAATGLTLSYEVPQGDYTGIQFSLGVSDDLNAKNPNHQPANSPLSDAADYWDAWNSYIFSKLEGSVDTLNNNRFDKSFTIHTGGAEGVYKPLIFNQSIPIHNNTKLNFEIDMNKILAGIDLKTVDGAHTLNDVTKMKAFMTAFSTAISSK
ncbi:MAG: hypothetical protein RLZZ628_4155 [Bacteroidota bacterium]|jgi:hypothetical protein